MKVAETEERTAHDWLLGQESRPQAGQREECDEYPPREQGMGNRNHSRTDRKDKRERSMSDDREKSTPTHLVSIGLGPGLAGLVVRGGSTCVDH